MSELHRFFELKREFEKARLAKKSDEEILRIWRKAEALIPLVIRTNLKNFGVDDMAVHGELYDENNVSSIAGTDMLLSDLCGLRHHKLAVKLNVKKKIALNITVSKDGVCLGKIDSDGRFRFENAPDLKTALAWKIATDAGRENIVEFYDVNRAALLILDTIREHGNERKSFFGPYFEALQRVFVYERTTRFADGYCGAAIVLWRVATRELGQMHDGYSFAY